MNTDRISPNDHHLRIDRFIFDGPSARNRFEIRQSRHPLARANPIALAQLTIIDSRRRDAMGHTDLLEHRPPTRRCTRQHDLRHRLGIIGLD